MLTSSLPSTPATSQRPSPRVAGWGVISRASSQAARSGAVPKLQGATEQRRGVNEI